jgi:hypothetical protein
MINEMHSLVGGVTLGSNFTFNSVESNRHRLAIHMFCGVGFRLSVRREKAAADADNAATDVPNALDPHSPAVHARVRGADARSAKGVFVSLRRCKAVWSADREGDACDLRRTRAPGAAMDRETVDVCREDAHKRHHPISIRQPTIPP